MLPGCLPHSRASGTPLSPKLYDSGPTASSRGLRLVEMVRAAPFFPQAPLTQVGPTLEWGGLQRVD